MHPEATRDGPGDWYALLGLPPTATADQIAEAADRLASEASAASATAPEISRDLYRQVAALRADLLSGDDRRRRYDELLAHREWAAATQSPSAAGGVGLPPAGGPTTGPAYRLGDAPVPGNPVLGNAVPGNAVSGDPEAGHAVPGRPEEAAADGSPDGTFSAGQPGSEDEGRQAGPGEPPDWPGGPAGKPGAPPHRTAGLMGRIARFLQTAWTCPSCGHGALPSDKFCQKCGTRIRPPSWTEDAAGDDARPQLAPSVLCGACGSRISAGNFFCTHCGAKRP